MSTSSNQSPPSPAGASSTPGAQSTQDQETAQAAFEQRAAWKRKTAQARSRLLDSHPEIAKLIQERTKLTARRDEVLAQAQELASATEDPNTIRRSLACMVQLSAIEGEIRIITESLTRRRAVRPRLQRGPTVTVDPRG